MTERETAMSMEQENMKLIKENEKLKKVIVKLNQTLNRMIVRYISSDQMA